MSEVVFTPNAHPATGAFSITPNDSADLSKQARSLYIGTTGNIRVLMWNGDEVTFENMPVGYHPIAVKKVFATDTTASDIIGLVD